MDIRDLIQEDDGYLRIEKLAKYGITKEFAYSYLAQHPEIKRCGHGLYYDSSLIDPDYEYALTYHKGDLIFSHETALWLHGLIDERPRIMTVTLPAGYNTRHLTNKDYVYVYTFREDVYKTGIIDIGTRHNHTVRCYNKERAVCDVVRAVRLGKTNLHMPNRFIERYFESATDSDVDILLEYASMMSIKNEMTVLARLLYG